MPKTSFLRLIPLAILAALLGVAGCHLAISPEDETASENVTLIELRELPEVSPDVLVAQGSLFRLEEPFLYDKKTKVATFVVEILSTKNFDSEIFLVFGGDAKSLQSFTNEIRLVNAPPGRIRGVNQGMKEGVENLANGLWQLLRHPIESVKGLGGSAASITRYLKSTPPTQVKQDIQDLAEAYYVNRATEVADRHSIDYFDLKTIHAKAAIHGETNSRLGGQASVELAALLVPYAQMRYVGGANKVLRAGPLFATTAGKMAATLKRLEYAAPVKPFIPPVAKLGNATSLDYRATFFTKYPEVEGKVNVHHAIEQQVLTRYPGVLTEAELHSLENLRGIPKELDRKLHLGVIRKEWNEFYRANPSPSISKQSLLNKATEIDRKYGHDFNPRLL